MLLFMMDCLSNSLEMNLIFLIKNKRILLIIYLFFWFPITAILVIKIRWCENIPTIDNQYF